VSRRRRRGQLSAEEEAAIVADIGLRKTLNDKTLMRKYNCSRSLLYTTWRKHKTNLVSCGTKTQNVSTAPPAELRTE
jgi:hypothetical protein